MKNNTLKTLIQRMQHLLQGLESGPERNIDLFAAIRFIVASQYNDSKKSNVDAWVLPTSFYQASMLQKLNLK